MAHRPTVITGRLVLRLFVPEDAAQVQRLAGAREVAATTLTIPHPYPDGAAEEWIARHAAGWADGSDATFAIVRRSGGALVGGIGLRIAKDQGQAELGYWIGVPHWNQGYCTEAAAAVLRYGFDELGLRRIHASHYSNNPASGRVMLKIGMKHEGRRRSHVLKWGEVLDLEEYGILADEWRLRLPELRSEPDADLRA